MENLDKNPPVSPDLDVEGWPEELVSAEETRGSVQLQRRLLLKLFPPGTALLIWFWGADVFGLHLVQDGTEDFALKATQVQWSHRFATLETQQWDFRR